MCEVHPGTVMLLASLFTALEVKRSDGCAELEVTVPVEQIQPLIASCTPRFFAENAQFIPCQKLSD